IPAAIDIVGPLAVPVLAHCFAELVSRHAALRTVFPANALEPLQEVLAATVVPLPLVDLEALPAARVAAEVERLTLAEARRPFDLAAGPLLRLNLLRPGEARWTVLLTFHHIVADGWSIGIVVREVIAIYEAAVRGMPSPLPELAIQYSDFARWQRREFGEGALAAQLAYWRSELADAPALLPLPTDRPRPAVQDLRGARTRREIPAELAAGLAACARQHGITPFMAFVAVFDVLLSLSTGQDDILIGTPVANRPRADVLDLVGLFINTLVLRSRLGRGLAFRELLARVRTTVLAAHAHQDMPFERLIQELGLERSLSHSPLFQVLLSHQAASFRELRMADLELSLHEVDSGMAKFDLTLEIQEHGGALSLSLEYATALFDRASAERLLTRFELLLGAAIASPQQDVSTFALLTEAEWHQLLVTWNRLEEGAAPLSTLPALFAAQSEQSPETIAVVALGEEVTYSDLAARARRLAAALCAIGVAPEVLVAVVLRPSVDLAVTLLAIQLSGGAFLLLDPEAPTERTSARLAAVEPAFLLSEERLRSRLPESPA
ncbi:MAG TPA: condensation domain-containing protein, partial [Thermoanaerobaculia bacterium]